MTFRFSSRVYPIIDDASSNSLAPLELTAAVLDGGARLLQLRVKNTTTRDFIDLALAAKKLTDAVGADLIINDRADIARLVDAAGVHLGQTDLPPVAARQIVGPGKWIGLSTHNDQQVCAAATQSEIDYIGFGPIFETASKQNPDPTQGVSALQRARLSCSLPIVAIGGITQDTAEEVLRSGADAVAMIGAICRATDPRSVTRALLSQIDA